MAKERYPERLTFRLSKEMYKKLQALDDRSDFIREAIHEKMQKM